MPTGSTMTDSRRLDVVELNQAEVRKAVDAIAAAVKRLEHENKTIRARLKRSALQSTALRRGMRGLRRDVREGRKDMASIKDTVAAAITMPKVVTALQIASMTLTGLVAWYALYHH